MWNITKKKKKPVKVPVIISNPKVTSFTKLFLDKVVDHYSADDVFRSLLNFYVAAHNTKKTKKGLKIIKHLEGILKTIAE